MIKNAIVGAEALTRWQHHGEYISPAQFIPILEEKNLISLLDTYIWECAFRLQSEKQKENPELIPISVNVSRRDFSDVDVYDILTGLSNIYEVSPDYIHIEITESAFVNDNYHRKNVLSGEKSVR